MKAKIREAYRGDIDFLVECENEYFHNFSTKDKIEEDFENPLIGFYLLTNPEPLGYVSLWMDQDKAQINSFVILKKYQNKGFGNIFLTNIFKILVDKNIKEITLEVRPSNIAAIKLYTKNGFVQVAVRKAYYNNGEDAFLMYKRLGSD